MEHIFPKKILIPGVFKRESTKLQLFQGEYLFPGGSTHLLVNNYWGSCYFPVNNYWGALFSGEYLITFVPVLYYSYSK